MELAYVDAEVGMGERLLRYPVLLSLGVVFQMLFVLQSGATLVIEYSFDESTFGIRGRNGEFVCPPVEDGGELVCVAAMH